MEYIFRQMVRSIVSSYQKYDYSLILIFSTGGSDWSATSTATSGSYGWSSLATDSTGTYLVAACSQMCIPWCGAGAIYLSSDGEHFKL